MVCEVFEVVPSSAVNFLHLDLFALRKLVAKIVFAVVLRLRGTFAGIVRGAGLDLSSVRDVVVVDVDVAVVVVVDVVVVAVVGAAVAAFALAAVADVADTFAFVLVDVEEFGDKGRIAAHIRIACS